MESTLQRKVDRASADSGQLWCRCHAADDAIRGYFLDASALFPRTQSLRHHPRLRQEHRRQRALRRPARRSRRRVHGARWPTPTSSSSTPAASSTRRRRSRSTRSSKRDGSRKTGSCKAVVGVGCMVQRHKDELVDALPEVDLFLGSSEMDRLDSRARGARADRRRRRARRCIRACACSPADCRTCAISRSAKGATTAARSARFRSCAASIARSRSTRSSPRRSCSRRRARARSTSWRRTSRTTAAIGATTSSALPDVLEALVRETTIPWIRMLYLYSAGLTPRLLEVMAHGAAHPAVSRHADSARVGRGAGAHASARAAAHDSREGRRAFATSCRTSRFARRASSDFPARRRRISRRCSRFLEEMQFERVGAFTYSPQEGHARRGDGRTTFPRREARAPRAVERAAAH